MILASNGLKTFVFESSSGDVKSEDLSHGSLVSFKGWVFEVLSFASQSDGKSSTIISHPAHVASSDDNCDPYNVTIRKENLIWVKDVPSESSLYKQIHDTYIKPVVKEPKADLSELKKLLAGLTPEELAELQQS